MADVGAGASLPISLSPGPWNTALPASHHIQTEVLVILVGDPAPAGTGSRPGRDGTRHSTGPGAPLGWMNRAWEAGDKKLLQPDGPEADLSPRKVAGGTRGAKHGGILVIAPLQDLQEGRVGGEGVWELEAVQTCGSRGGALAHGAEQAHRPQPPGPHPAALPQPQPDPHGSISSCQMLTGRGCPRRHPSPHVPPANSPPSGRRGLRLRAPRAGPLSVSSPHPCPASGGARAGAREACGSRPADGKEPRGGSTLPAGFLPSEHAGV